MNAHNMAIRVRNILRVTFKKRLHAWTADHSQKISDLPTPNGRSSLVTKLHLS